MPGIVGLITKIPHDRAVTQLNRMVESLLHEAFYSSGTWMSERLGVYVGWISQGGASDSVMPVRTGRGDVIMAFSGEEYSGSTQVPASEGLSYLAQAYKDDESFPCGLNGRFHGLLVDLSRETALLFNDRFAMHRVYVHEAKDAFYFAAEAKAILAVCPDLRQIDMRCLGELVSCGGVLENRSLFRGVQVLPAASKWIFRDSELKRKDSYFDPKLWEDQEALDPETYCHELRAVFVQNLPRYFEGPERVGMSLTGGLDTRMVLACGKPTPGSLPCYTFGSMYRESQDVRIARRVAKECGQEFQVLTAAKEFLERFSKYAERAVFLTDGCVGVSRAPDLYLNEQARMIAPVRMTGLYGGEILRGMRAFKPVMPVEGLYSKELLEEVQRSSKTYERLVDCHPVSFAVFRQNPWYLQGPLSLERTQLQVRSPFLDNDFLRTVFRSPAAELKSNHVSWHLAADGNRTFMKIPTDRGLTGRGGGLLEAMRHGILEFLFKAEYAYDTGMPQWLAGLDHAFSALHLERAFLGRHKPFHFRVWYRDELAEYVREVLLDSRSVTRPYIERNGVEAIVTGHLSGKRNYTAEIHNLLSLELIHRLFLDFDWSNNSLEKRSAITTCSV